MNRNWSILVDADKQIKNLTDKSRALGFFWCGALHIGRLLNECSCDGPMKSVPPRGSEWVVSLPSVNFRLPIGLSGKWSMGNRYLAIGNLDTHPLPRGGTDFIGPPHD